MSVEVKDQNAPQSLHFWYKQMNDKVNFSYKKYWDEMQRGQPTTDPIQYFFDTPKTEKIPDTSLFESWPLQRKVYQMDYDFVPQKRVMFQPKKTANHELNIDFYVSPRIFIRYTKTWVTDVMYADSF